MWDNDIDSIKNVVSGGLIIFIGAIVSKTGGFLRQFIIVRLLTPEQYGIFALGLSFLVVLSALGNLGYNIGAQRYIAFYDAKGEYSKIRGIIHNTLKVVITSGIIISTSSILFSDKISKFLSKPDFRNPFIIFCLLVPMAILIQTFTSFFLGLKRATLAVSVNSFSFSISSVIFIFVSLLIRKETIYATLGLLLSYFLVLNLVIIAAKRNIYPKIKGYEAESIGMKLFKFSLPLFFVNISNLILINTDTLMLGYFTASDLVGIYNAAFLLSNFIAIFLESLGAMFMPVLTNLIAGDKIAVSKGLYQAVTRWIFTLTLPLLLTFLLFPSHILSLIFSNLYARAGLCLAILAVSEFLNVFLGPNYQALTAFGEGKILLVSWTTAAVSNITMNYFFIRKWGINGAATATGISLVILNIINSMFLYKKHGVHPFGRKYIVPVSISMGVSVLFYLPLRVLVERSSWFVLLCYPLFLVLGIGSIFLTRNVAEEDVLIYKAMKARVKNLLKH